MIVEFNFENFLSFREKQSLSLLTGSKKKEEEHKNNYVSFSDDKYRILKTVAIYGANASGKSNILKAMTFMRNFVVNSHTTIPNDLIRGVEPFRLNVVSRKKPAFFELKFILDNTRYTYNFSLNNKEVVSENLIAYYSAKPTVLIKRDYQEIEINGTYMKKAEKWKEDIRENSLTLSFLADRNVEEAKKIHAYFLNIHVFFNINGDTDTMNMLNRDTKFKFFLINLLKDSDFGIKDVKHEQKDVKFSDLPENVKEDMRKKVANVNFDEIENLKMGTTGFVHEIYNEAGEKSGEEFFAKESESVGTQQIFNLAGSIYDIMKNGKILFIDEIDRSIHSMLLKKLIKVFHNSTGDLGNYQFIFNTHDTTLLDLDLFRRDQIWFVEKNKKQESSLYSLLEFKQRKDVVLSKNYMENRYGATPYLGKFDDLFK